MLRCVCSAGERIDSILLYKNGSWALITWFSSVSQHFTQIIPWRCSQFADGKQNPEVPPESRVGLEKQLQVTSLLVPCQVTATSWYISKLNATLICLIPPKLMMNEFSVARKHLAKPHGFLWTAPGVLHAQGTWTGGSRGDGVIPCSGSDLPSWRKRGVKQRERKVWDIKMTCYKQRFPWRNTFGDWSSI